VAAASPNWFQQVFSRMAQLFQPQAPANATPQENAEFTFTPVSGAVEENPAQAPAAPAATPAAPLVAAPAPVAPAPDVSGIMNRLRPALLQLQRDTRGAVGHRVPPAIAGDMGRIGGMLNQYAEMLPAGSEQRRAATAASAACSNPLLQPEIIQNVGRLIERLDTSSAGQDIPPRDAGRRMEAIRGAQRNALAEFAGDIQILRPDPMRVMAQEVPAAATPSLLVANGNRQTITPTPVNPRNPNERQFFLDEQGVPTASAAHANRMVRGTFETNNNVVSGTQPLRQFTITGVAPVANGHTGEIRRVNYQSLNVTNDCQSIVWDNRTVERLNATFQQQHIQGNPIPAVAAAAPANQRQQTPQQLLNAFNAACRAGNSVAAAEALEGINAHPNIPTLTDRARAMNLDAAQTLRQNPNALRAAMNAIQPNTPNAAQQVVTQLIVNAGHGPQFGLQPAPAAAAAPAAPAAQRPQPPIQNQDTILRNARGAFGNDGSINHNSLATALESLAARRTNSGAAYRDAASLLRSNPANLDNALNTPIDLNNRHSLTIRQILNPNTPGITTEMRNCAIGFIGTSLGSSDRNAGSAHLRTLVNTVREQHVPNPLQQAMAGVQLGNSGITGGEHVGFNGAVPNGGAPVIAAAAPQRQSSTGPTA